MNTKRQIKGTQYNIPELVRNAIITSDNENSTLPRDARICNKLMSMTGNLGFRNQVGKIDFSTVEKAIAGVDSYLNRRNAGNHARWTENHRGY